jgi:Ni/Fe-hydrogenase subunit HybB-like protein
MLARFFADAFRQMFRGGWVYWTWVVLLLAVVVLGLWHYAHQLRDGLVVSGMSDQVSWGLYIGNFTFLVGFAAAAVLLVIPAYVFHREDVKDVVLLGDSVAVAAVVMAVLFILVDLGRVDRIWHMIPYLGRFHWPTSMLAWDVVVLNGYLLLNLGISFYILYSHYRGHTPQLRLYFPFVVLAMFWAISIHTVTAFLFSANSGRPFWHTALLAPRFIASAFCSGPAIAILVLQFVRRVSNYPIRKSVIDMLTITMTISLQVTLFFTLVEWFTEFYNEGADAAPARYLWFGLHGHSALVPWIWAAFLMLLAAVTILMINPLRKRVWLLNLACALTAVGVWIDKGIGLVVPGFVPTPLGEVFEYFPTTTEVWVTIGIWAAGILLFTLLAKVAIPIECGTLRLEREDAEDICTSRPGVTPVGRTAPAQE